MNLSEFGLLGLNSIFVSKKAPFFSIVLNCNYCSFWLLIVDRVIQCVLTSTGRSLTLYSTCPGLVTSLLML